jgi:hypothetical protein
MNTIVKKEKRLSLSTSGTGPSPRKLKLILTLELEDDDEPGARGPSVEQPATASDDSAIGSRPSSAGSVVSPDPLVAAVTSAEPAATADVADDGDADIDEQVFRDQLNGEQRTSTDDEDDQTAGSSEASTRDDDPRDWTVKTAELEVDSADTTIDWFVPETGAGVVSSRVRAAFRRE